MPINSHVICKEEKRKLKLPSSKPKKNRRKKIQKKNSKEKKN